MVRRELRLRQVSELARAEGRARVDLLELRGLNHVIREDLRTQLRLRSVRVRLAVRLLEIGEEEVVNGRAAACCS